MKYKLELDYKTIQVVLMALGAKAWETRGTEAYKSYDNAYKTINKQGYGQWQRRNN